MRNEQFDRMCRIEALRLQELIDPSTNNYLVKNNPYSERYCRINVMYPDPDNKQGSVKVIDTIGTFNLFPLPQVVVAISKIQFLRDIDHSDMFIDAVAAPEPYKLVSKKILQVDNTNTVILLMNPMVIIDDLQNRRKKLELTQRKNDNKEHTPVQGRDDSYGEHPPQLQYTDLDGNRCKAYGETLGTEAWAGYRDRN